MLRVTLCLSVSLILAMWSVTVLRAAPEEAGWHIVSRGSGCLSYASATGTPAVRNVVLTPDLQHLLLGLVGKQSLEQPQCWYETPDFALMLSAGPACGFFKEVRFRKVATRWALDSVKEQYSQCERRRVQ